MGREGDLGGCEGCELKTTEADLISAVEGLLDAFAWRAEETVRSYGWDRLSTPVMNAILALGRAKDAPAAVILAELAERNEERGQKWDWKVRDKAMNCKWTLGQTGVMTSCGKLFGWPESTKRVCPNCSRMVTISGEKKEKKIKKIY